MGFPSGSVVKNLPLMQEMQETQVQSLGREDPPEEGMQHAPVFLPENPMDRGAWWAMVHGVAKSQTWLKRLSMDPCIIKSERENGMSCSFISPKSYNPRLSWWLRPGPQTFTICCIGLTHLCPNSKAASGHILLFERSDLRWVKICFPIISNPWF